MPIEKPLRVLLLGNGGREHAIAWRLSQSPKVEAILVVPGNGGTALCPKTTNVSSLSAEDFPALAELAKKENVNFLNTMVRHCFGPSKKAAQMEGSKTFSKDFMKKWGIPTAEYENFSDYEKARQYVDQVQHDVVIKADGLAAGKGVLMPTTKEEAQQGLKEIMLNREFGSAGDEVVVEECLLGDELSIITFSDGHTIRSLPPAQDHKRIGDGDTGLNTGVWDAMRRQTLQPRPSDGMIFRGVLFTGLMITKTGPKVLEYNVRFGDPETQTLLPLLSEDTDLAEIMYACCESDLDRSDLIVKVDPKSCATVVVAAGGYPEAYGKGDEITVQTPPSGINIFHAGTKLSDGKVQSAGGRVIASSATGDDLRAAVDRAYEGVKLINFNKMYYRKDIAHRAFRPTEDTKKAMTYAQAGVSIDAGNRVVEEIKQLVKSTAILGANADIGGFGGEVDLGLKLVSCIDGVGTKLMIAQEMNKHDTVGIDLVAMNVNDLVVQGAQPLSFLDYFGCSNLEPQTTVDFVRGVADGCIQSGCALVGGETAEMPGMYKPGDYDAAGCANGIVESKHALPKLDKMAPGDVLLGLASSGVHSNGFSLVRRIIEAAQLSYHDAAPWDKSGVSVGNSLLTPTKIYVKPLLKARSQLKGLAHITGGGLTENVPRVLPKGLAAEIDAASWELPPVFKWLKQAGNVAASEMARTFNTGIGMVAVVAPEEAASVAQLLQAEGETVYTIGKLVSRSGEGCVLKNLESWG
ncbi:hypothetical protein PG997_004282 [Apiospora hydei]|uniref:phosphoribosylformylglycinamidine cyclo-ligase n=1 Tax=Apiospora hydei TaxID=1337664 RepID=A0ABR1X1Q3_9PEZI